MRTTMIMSAALAVVGVALVPMTAGAEPGVAATTCLGKPVTIVASTAVTVGTEGDDVVAMTPSGWSNFDARGGNDTICLALGKDYVDSPASGTVDAGAGDDVVINEASPAAGASMSVGLGAGEDTFTGNNTPAHVFADSAFTYGLPTFPPAGAQRDVINTGTGGGSVASVAPPGGLNDDRITFGGGDAQVVYIGAMGPQGLVDLTAAAAQTLWFPLPGAVEPLGRGELLVDNVSRRATVGGAQVFAWSGEVNVFLFGQDGATSSRLPVSFVGSEADEDVTVSGGPVGDVRLAGGDDSLSMQTYNDAFVPRSADGGAGSDSARLETRCLHMRVENDGSATCDGASGTFGGFEEVIATSLRSDSTVDLIGTAAAERLVAHGGRVTVLGRSGADEILVDDARTTRVSGGGGGDDMYVTGADVIVKGQAGRDRIVLAGLQGGPAAAVARQVALGGRGADELRGTDEVGGDRLVGGRGRDSANGQGGKLDRCLAETTKNCELPK